MSKKVKVLVSVLVAVVLLTMGGTATVLAQEGEPAPTPEPSTTTLMATANTTGLLARVAEKLGITEEELINAFKQAQQEMRDEAFFRYLDKAVEEGLIDEGEAEAIKQWWGQRPEVLGSGLFPGVFGTSALCGIHMWSHGANVTGEMPITPGIAEQFKLQWQNRINTNNCPVPRLQIAKAIRGRQQIAVPRGWQGARTPELAD